MSADPEREPLTLVVVVLTAPYPVGGPLCRYELANELARRGHTVHIVHLFPDAASRSEGPAPVGWFRFDPSISHHHGYDSLPSSLRADVTLGVSDRRFLPPSGGLPFTHLQGLSWNGSDEAPWIANADGPIACVSQWLVATCTALGVAPHRVRHIPNGIDLTTFRPLDDPFDRPPRVSFLHHPMPAKGALESVAALEVAKRELPELEVRTFGVEPRPTSLPAWMEYVERPDHHRLATEVYNASRAFVCTSRSEGFGLTSLEAMACGSALVTFDTGGSRDYAHDGETALVVEQGAVDALASSLLAVLRDGDLHRRLVTGALTEVQAFTWERATDQLEALLREYLSEPRRFSGG